jgi:FtsH-binding integral membrane protein
MLAVLTNRLGRIIDRARAMEDRHQAAEDPALRHRLHRDLKVLSQRSRLVSRAIAFCTACSLFVSLVIAVLFLQALFDVYVHGMVPVLFIVAMLAFIAGLLLFLREIQIATSALRIGPPDDEAG